MKRFATTGRTERGKLRVRHARQYDEALAAFGDCEVVVTIEKRHAHRSKRQNDYMWAVVIPRVQSAFKSRKIEAGNDPDVTNEVLKSMFMDPELVRTGQIRGFVSDTGLMIGTHTSDLNTLQFIEYLDRVCEHAATAWDTYVPPPDPLWREQAQQEAVQQDPRDTMRREKGHAA